MLKKLFLLQPLLMLYLFEVIRTRALLFEIVKVKFEEVAICQSAFRAGHIYRVYRATKSSVSLQGIQGSS